MSTAVAFSSYGGPEVLEAIEIETPRPAAGQVIVRVESAGVQPFDVRVRRGDLRRWVPVSFPQVLGNEFAGVIEEVAAAGLTHVRTIDAWPPADKNPAGFLVLFRKAR